MAGRLSIWQCYERMPKCNVLHVLERADLHRHTLTWDAFDCM